MVDSILLPGDRYEYEKYLGKGGMGEVHQMRDKQLRRSVAMKRLLPDRCEDAYSVSALLTEASVAGMLEHPNIIPVYDVGQLTDGAYYYTMRLMDRMSLHDVLDLLRKGNPEVQRKYPLVHLIRLFLRVCMGVDYAHSRGVIHRDLKPENIRLGRFGEVQVADWGLAKVEGAPDYALEKALRDAGDMGEEPCIVIGSPNYMSPEQACGYNDRVGPSSDIYSLGCTLYEILTLVPPQDDTDTMVLLDKVEREEPVAPGKRAPNRIIPPILEEICMGALEKDMLVRTQDVRVLIRCLEEFLGGQRFRAETEAQLFDALERGQRFSDAYTRLRESRETLRVDVEGESNSERRDMLQTQLDVLGLDVATAWNEAHTAFTRALGFDREDMIARAKLSELAWLRMLEAESEGDLVSCQLYWGMLRRYNDGPYDNYLIGHGKLTVESTPVGAMVKLTDYVEPTLEQRDRQGRSVGYSPAVMERLPAGLYSVTAELDGYETLTWPVFLGSDAKRRVVMELDQDVPPRT